MILIDLAQEHERIARDGPAAGRRRDTDRKEVPRRYRVRVARIFEPARQGRRDRDGLISVRRVLPAPDRRRNGEAVGRDIGPQLRERRGERTIHLVRRFGRQPLHSTHHGEIARRVLRLRVAAHDRG